MQLKELAKDLFQHNFVGITVKYNDYYEDNGERVESLTFSEYEEPQTTYRTCFSVIEGSDVVFVDEETIGDGVKHGNRATLDLDTFTWSFKGYYLCVTDGKERKRYEICMNEPNVEKVTKKSDIIVAS